MKAAILIMAVTSYIPANPTGATGEPILAGMTCAVPREMRHLLGTWVHVEGHGERYVNDVTHIRIKNNIDLAVATIEEAREIGRQTGRRVTR